MHIPQEIASGIALDLELPPSGRLIYWPAYLDAGQAEALFDRLQLGLDWRQLPVRLFGRQIPQPRLTDFHADAGISYTYSGLRLEGCAWPLPLAALRERLNAELGQAFNSVLCNLYRDGRDYMGWHADDEPTLGADPVIASLSLGIRRRFQLRPRQRARVERRELMLEPGSLLVMAGDLQRHWLHQLPKSLQVKTPRINLTFRRIQA